jgi:hypothetical protein
MGCILYLIEIGYKIKLYEHDVNKGLRISSNGNEDLEVGRAFIETYFPFFMYFHRHFYFYQYCDKPES